MSFFFFLITRSTVARDVVTRYCRALRSAIPTHGSAMVFWTVLLEQMRSSAPTAWTHNDLVIRVKTSALTQGFVNNIY